MLLEECKIHCKFYKNVLYSWVIVCLISQLAFLMRLLGMAAMHKELCRLWPQRSETLWHGLVAFSGKKIPFTSVCSSLLPFLCTCAPCFLCSVRPLSWFAFSLWCSIASSVLPRQERVKCSQEWNAHIFILLLLFIQSLAEYRIQIELLKTTENRYTIWCSHSTPGNTSK